MSIRLVGRGLILSVLAIGLISCGGSSTDNPSGLSCSVSPTSGEAPLNVRFTASAKDATRDDFYWMFSDNTAAPGPTVQRMLHNGGIFRGTVMLVRTGQTCTAEVAVGASVRLACYADPEQVVIPGEVRFRAEPSGGSGVFSYLWDFGDGATATEKGPSHVYREVRSYLAKVTATSGAMSATCNKTIEGLKTGITVTCSANPTDGNAPMTVDFTSGATGGNGTYHYSWWFGDGQTSHESSPSHTYTLEGSYTAVVTVESGPSEGRCSQNIYVGNVIACGDGKVQGSETCDDGNTAAGDGCSATCKVEHGFACAGAPSVCTATCGDGLMASTEGCDDGNAAPGDGCSAACAIEHGFACAGEPSVCTATCGDGLVASTEGCDDGNAAPGDGCSAACAVEHAFACAGEPSVCTATCGDGLVASTEGCDDGNTAAGDGCSATCTVEPGFTCAGEPSVCV